MTDTSKQWIKDAAKEIDKVPLFNAQSLRLKRYEQIIAAHAPQAPQPVKECICSDGFGMNLSCPVHGTEDHNG